MQKQEHPRNTRRATWLFVLFLLLGGLLHANEYGEHPYFPSTLLYLLVFTVYSALLLYWLQSLRERLLRSAPRGYVMLAGMLLLLYLMLRTVKYRVEGPVALTRYLWYLYYVPIIAVPMLFLMTCISFLRTASHSSAERYLLIPACVLILGILTNDLHGLAFRPYGEIASLQGTTGTYAYGFVYYASYAWIGACVVTGVVLLLVVARGKRDWKKAGLPLAFLAAIPLLITAKEILKAHGGHAPYEDPEIYIFCMLGVFEMCIRNHLLPGNENYPGFFAQMNTPARITDDGLRTVYETAVPVNVAERQLRSALKAPLSLDADTRLLGKRLTAGNAYWMEDESTLHRLNERLEDMGEFIGLENRLIRYEHE